MAAPKDRRRAERVPTASLPVQLSDVNGVDAEQVRKLGDRQMLSLAKLCHPHRELTDLPHILLQRIR